MKSTFIGTGCVQKTQSIRHIPKLPLKRMNDNQDICAKKEESGKSERTHVYKVRDLQAMFKT